MGSRVARHRFIVTMASVCVCRCRCGDTVRIRHLICLCYVLSSSSRSECVRRLHPATAAFGAIAVSGSTHVQRHAHTGNYLRIRRIFNALTIACTASSCSYEYVFTRSITPLAQSLLHEFKQNDAKHQQMLYCFAQLQSTIRSPRPDACYCCRSRRCHTSICASACTYEPNRRDKHK